MDTAFSNMAKTWALLLLLLSLSSPLLSGHLLTHQGENGNSSTQSSTSEERVQLSISPTSPIIQDKENDTFTTVAMRKLDPEVTTREFDPEVTTREFDQEVTTRGLDPEVTTSGPDLEVTTSGPDLEVTTSGPDPEMTTSGPDPEVTTSELDMKSIQSSNFSWSEMFTPSVMANDSAETTDPAEHSTENIATTETITETAPSAVTTATLKTSPVSTQHPGPSTSGPTNSTNTTDGALVPRINPGGRPLITQPPEIKPTTTDGDHVPADKGRFPCVTPTSRKDGLVSQCLIAIASLAAVATIFIVSTTVLCTKLSSSKYRYRMSQAYGTEMVCISALLPDGNGTHGRPRIPKSNGALIPNVEDSEGDDLTLHSFLPDSDRGS